MAAKFSDASRFALWVAVFALLYVIGFGLAFPAFIDEAFTFNLATDRSLSHMLTALGDGADGTSPLFATLIFVWEKCFGSSELSLRLGGGIFTVLFVGHTGWHLVRRFPPVAVVLALLVVLANEEFIFHAAQARFYGFVLLAFSLAFWSTLGLIESRHGSRGQWWRHAGCCGLLWLSHPFGVIYAAILALLYGGFSRMNATFSWSRALAFLGGPVLFLFWLPTFLIQGEVRPSFAAGLQVPGWGKYWEFAFLSSPVFCGVCGLGLLLALAGRRGWLAEAPNPIPANRLLVVYAGAFIVVLNAVIASLDAAGVIGVYLMLALRYVLVTVVAYAVVCSAAAAAMGRFVRKMTAGRPWGRSCPGVLQGLAAVLLLGHLVQVWKVWSAVKSEREPYLDSVAAEARAKNLEVICENQADAFLLATRTAAPDVKYFLRDDYHSRALMFRLQKHYPRPSPITVAEVRREPRDFVLLRSGLPAHFVRAPVAVAR